MCEKLPKLGRSGAGETTIGSGLAAALREEGRLPFRTIQCEESTSCA